MYHRCLCLFEFGGGFGLSQLREYQPHLQSRLCNTEGRPYYDLTSCHGLKAQLSPSPNTKLHRKLIKPLTQSIRERFKMADVDMTDAPAVPSGAKGKAAVRAGKSGTPSDPATEGKKRFEVKKV